MLRGRKHSKEEKINNDNKLSCQGKYWCLHAKENVYLKSSYSPNRHLKNKQTLFASARCYFRIKPSHALKCRTSLSSGLYVQVRGIPSVAHSAWCSLSALLRHQPHRDFNQESLFNCKPTISQGSAKPSSCRDVTDWRRCCIVKHRKNK